MYVLYGGQFTRALMVQMVMAEADIPFDLVEIDIISQQHRSEAFLAINPAGFVPALKLDNGTVLHETHAINLFLIDRHQVNQLGPLADDDLRGEFLSGLFFIADDLEPALKTLFYPHRYVFDEKDITAMRVQAFDQVINRLGVVEQRLQAGGPYYLGERFSLIDIALAYWAMTISPDTDFENLPAIQQHMRRVIKRPRIRLLFEEMHRNNLAYREKQNVG